MRAIVSLLAAASFLIPASSEPRRLSTWSIAAADLQTGMVGVAGASCVPNTHIDAIAALVPGKGVAATQAFFDLSNRNKVFGMLRAGESADEIIKQVTNRSGDISPEDRQYGVVTFKDGVAKAVGFTGKSAIPWAGSEQDQKLAFSVQGNILEGANVVADAARAFREPGSLPDRLMRALEAGSAAGGDSRCNNARVKQTAAAAFILVARGNDPPYATRDLGATDEGRPGAPWLALSVRYPDFGPNPVTELRKKINAWKSRQ